jgi:hypothetical protein
VGEGHSAYFCVERLELMESYRDDARQNEHTYHNDHDILHFSYRHLPKTKNMSPALGDTFQPVYRKGEKPYPEYRYLREGSR